MRASTVRRPAPSIGRVAIHAVVVVFMIVWFTPILGLLISSLRVPSEMARSGWWTVFVKPLLTGNNYQQAISLSHVDQSIWTSLAMAIPTTIITTLLSAIGAFAFTRMAFRGQLVLSLPAIEVKVRSVLAPSRLAASKMSSGIYRWPRRY